MHQKILQKVSQTKVGEQNVRSTEKKMVEICSFSLESCLTAQKAGATRIELCGGMPEGGTTPSAGLVITASKKIKIPIRAMLRPRGGDFCYTENEVETMLADLAFMKKMPIEGIVFGALNPEGKIDKKLIKSLLDFARKDRNDLKFTFHRAFDVSENPHETLEEIIELGFDTLLTSGQKNTAIEGIDLIEKLVKQANDRIEIMAGSGVNAKNADDFLKIGLKSLHLSAKTTFESKMIFRNQEISMGGGSVINEFEVYEAGYGKIREVVEIFEKTQNADF